MEEYVINVNILNAELSLGIKKITGGLTIQMIKALRKKVNVCTWDKVNTVWDPKWNFLCIFMYGTFKKILLCVFLLLKTRMFSGIPSLNSIYLTSGFVHTMEVVFL